MNGSFLFSASKSEEAKLETFNCCGTVSTGNVGTILSALENVLERTLLLEEVVRHMLNSVELQRVYGKVSGCCSRR